MSNYIQSNQMVRLPVPLVATLTNLISESDSGKILILGVQTAIQTFTLPLPKAGLRYKIICDAVINFAVTISTNPVSLFYGNLTNVSTVAITTASVGLNAGSWPIVVAAKNGSTSFIFTAFARPGDNAELICDGAFWYLNGMSTTTNVSGATFAATLLTAGLN